MPDSNADPAQREILRQLRELSDRLEKQGKDQTDRYDRLDRAINSTETPIGVRLDVRDIKRTLEGYAREPGLTQRVETLEGEMDESVNELKNEVKAVQSKLDNLISSGAVKEAKQEGIKIGRGALIGGAIALLGVLATLSAIVSTWLARYAPPG